MIKKKIKKYTHIAKAMLGQEEELKKLNSNTSSEFVKKAFQYTKKGIYSTAEQNIFRELELYKKELATNKTQISYEIFNTDEKKSVSEIAPRAGSPGKWCEFFYFLSKFSNAKNILEIGTNLGVSGQYFLSAIRDEPSKFISLEGVPGLCSIASERFDELAGKQTEFEVVQGLYDETLPKIAASGQTFDLVFFDGNHKYEPTLHYFDLLKDNFSRHAILIFDDIYWDEQMEKAWRQLKEIPGVYCTIDFFKLGIVLYDKKKQGLPRTDCKLFLTF